MWFFIQNNILDKHFLVNYINLKNRIITIKSMNQSNKEVQPGIRAINQKRNCLDCK